MEKPDIQRLIARAKAEESQRESELAQRLERQRQDLLEAERRRVKNLESMVQHWLNTMAGADYRSAQLFTIVSQEKVRGLFSTKIKTVEEQAVGWFIGGVGGWDESGSWGWGISLLVDGELVAGGQDGSKRLETIKGYRIGSDFELISHRNLDGTFLPRPTVWRSVEDTIPDKLKQIAFEVGVPWEYEPSA